MIFLNSNSETLFLAVVDHDALNCRTCDIIFLNSNYEILYYDHALVYSVRLDRSNTDRYITTHAGGPHWPEQDAQIDIAWIVGED
jgi:hypothetical protein